VDFLGVERRLREGWIGGKGRNCTLLTSTPVILIYYEWSGNEREISRPYPKGDSCTMQIIKMNMLEGFQN